MKDVLENFLIFDIVLLSYNGDHVLCESCTAEKKDQIDHAIELVKNRVAPAAAIVVAAFNTEMGKALKKAGKEIAKKSIEIVKDVAKDAIKK